MPDKLIIYTTPNCRACDNALANLTTNGLDLGERNVMRTRQCYYEVPKYSVSVPEFSSRTVMSSTAGRESMAARSSRPRHVQPD